MKSIRWIIWGVLVCGVLIRNHSQAQSGSGSTHCQSKPITWCWYEDPEDPPTPTLPVHPPGTTTGGGSGHTSGGNTQGNVQGGGGGVSGILASQTGPIGPAGAPTGTLHCFTLTLIVFDPKCSPTQVTKSEPHLVVTGVAKPSQVQADPKGSSTDPIPPGKTAATQGGDPMDLGNRQYHRDENLFTLKDRDREVPFTLIYDSLVEPEENFGKRWKSNFDEKLFVHWTAPGGVVSYISYYRDRLNTTFIPSNQPNLFTSINGAYLKIEKTDGSPEISYLLREPNGTIRQFGSSVFNNSIETVWLKSVVDRYGTTLTLQYFPSMRLDRVFGSHGQKLFQFDYYDLADYEQGNVLPPNIGKVKAITDNRGRAWKFEYDEFENLKELQWPASEFVDPKTANSVGAPFTPINTALITKYEYDAFNNHFLTGVKEASDDPAYSLQTVFDTDVSSQSWGRVVSQTDAKGAKWFFRSDDLTPGYFDVLDKNTAKSRVLTIQPDGYARIQDFNGAGKVLRDRLYNEKPDFAALPTNITIEALSANWTLASESLYQYNAEGELSFAQAPEGNFTIFVHNNSFDRFQQGNLLWLERHQGPRGDGGNGFGEQVEIRSFEYEPYFNELRGVTDSLGRRTEILFDYFEASEIAPSLQAMAQEWGILNTQTLPLGQGDLNEDGETNRHRGDVIAIRKPDAHLVDPTQAGSPQITQSSQTKFQSNDFGQVTKVINAEGHASALSYFEDGVHDGWIKEVIGDVSGIHSKTQFNFDESGRLLSKTDPRGVISNYEWTNLDHLKSVRLAAAIDPANNSALLAIPEQETRLYYDFAANLARVEKKRLVTPGQNEWVVTALHYDPMNNLIEQEEQVSASPLKSRKTRFEYDGADRVRRILTPMAVASGASGTDFFNTETIYRNALGLPCQVVKAQGSESPSVTSYQYDQNGNVIAAYDSVINESGIFLKLIGCGGYSGGDATTFIYDGFDRLTQSFSAAGTHATFGYDVLSNLIFESVQGRKDGPQSPIVPLSTSYSSYDELNRLVRRDFSYFDASGALLEDQNHDGNVQSVFFYNKESLLTVVQNDNLHNIFRNYDGLNRLQSLIDAAGNEKSFSYDPSGNLIELTQKERATNGTPDSIYKVSFQFDALNHVTKSVDSAGRANYQIPDYEGRALFEADPNGPLDGSGVNLPGNVIQHLYDSLGRRTESRHFLTNSGKGDGQMPPSAVSQIVKTQQVFDLNSRMIQRIDPKNQTTSYAYDALNRLRVETAADQKSKFYNYDADSHLIEEVQEDGTRLQFVYNSQDLPTKLTSIPSSASVTPVSREMHYDGLGRLTFASQTTNFSSLLTPQTFALTRSYDSLGNLREEKTKRNGAEFDSVRASFDGISNRTSLVYPDNSALSFGYDEVERLRTISRGAQPIADYDYIGGRILERKVFTSQGTSLQLSAQYDEALQLTKLTHTKNGSQLLEGFQYLFDRNRNRLSETRLNEGKRGDAIQLDSLYRMTKFQFNLPDAAAEVQNPGSGGIPQEATSFLYDAAGNRTRVSKKDETFEYTSNRVNEITAINGSPLRYDARGNLISQSSNQVSKRYSYDALNQLASFSDGEKTTLFVRDPLGRERIQIVSSSNGAPLEEIHTSFDGGRRIYEERFANGALTQSKRNVFGISLDELLVQENSAHGALYPLTNSLGSTTALANQSGEILERYRYKDGFGEPTFLAPNGQELQTSAYQFEFLFSGARYDYNAGLYDLRNRHYHPQLGRFIHRDPIGIWGDAANLGNGYAYVGNNSVNRVDPWGLEAKKKTEVEKGPHGPIINYPFPDDADFGSKAPKTRWIKADCDDCAMNIYWGRRHQDMADSMKKDAAEAKRLRDIAATTAVSMAASSTPGLGEALDIETICHPDSRWWERLLAGGSLAANFLTAGVLPNYSGAKAGVKAGGTIVEETKAAAKATEVAKETETFYRTMNKTHYEELLATGKLPASKETFITKNLEYAKKYDGVTVKFTVKSGTTDSLLDIGVKNAGLRESAYNSLPIVESGWASSSAFFKKEGEQLVNIGLGRGAALNMFNNSIVDFGAIPR